MKIFINGLEVLDEFYKLNKRGKYIKYCKVRCFCGEFFIATKYHLKSGHTKSCGCLRKNATSERNTTHGMANSKPYRIWMDMKKRCLNKNTDRYSQYGGRGIGVCEKWLSFNGFWQDMKGDYKDGLSIERKDVNDNYCKENCIWIPLERQRLNKQDTIWVVYQGEKYTLCDLAKTFNIKYHTLYARYVIYKIPIYDALNVKVNKVTHKFKELKKNA